MKFIEPYVEQVEAVIFIETVGRQSEAHDGI